MNRITKTGATVALALGLLVSACSKTKEVAVPKGTVPPAIADEKGAKRTDLKREVVQEVALTFATEKALRAARKNPVAYKFELVRYTNTDGRKSELVEVSLRSSGEVFYYLDAAFDTTFVGEEPVYGYKLSATITPSMGVTEPQNVNVGGFGTAEPSLLDLCTGLYEENCRFDHISDAAEFEMVLRLK